MALALVQRYDRDGLLLGSITADMMECNATYRLYGGGERCDMEFAVRWGEALVCSQGERITVRRNNIPVFSGRVKSVQPHLNDRQTVALDGWWRRMEELVVLPPPFDKVSFGFPEADHPDIVTAYGVVEWIFENKILPDLFSSITAGVMEEPPATTKLGPSGFVLYNNDKLAQVLETLATMDDCVCGVDASQQFYFVSRETILANPVLLTVPVAEEIAANWKTSSIGIPRGGSFIEDRRGPTYLAVRGRDIEAVRGTRTYRLATVESASTRRMASFYAPNIRHGQGARRFARGLFRRYSDFGTKVENLDFVSGVQRMEPHLGPVTVTNDGALVATKLAGTIDASWLRPTISGQVNLGENKPEFGTGNPLTDPMAAIGGARDDAQIDTGDSALIDFDDGFDGDGDDLHTNPARDVWTDPPHGLDYGEDKVDEDNGANSSAGANVWPAVITSVTNADSYGLDILEADEETVKSEHTNVKAWPKVPVPFEVGQKVNAYFPAGEESPLISGDAFVGKFPARISEVTGVDQYTVQVLSKNLLTVLATFEEVSAFPVPADDLEALRTVWVTFPNNSMTPFIDLGPGAGCGHALTAFGIITD